MALVYLGFAAVIAWLASRRFVLPLWENLLGAAVLAVLPTVIVWWALTTLD